jgi:hypothetical protein
MLPCQLARANSHQFMCCSAMCRLLHSTWACQRKLPCCLSQSCPTSATVFEGSSLTLLPNDWRHPPAQVQYDTGDYVAVFPENAEETVTAAAAALGVPLDTVFALRLPPGNPQQLSPPFPGQRWSGHRSWLAAQAWQCHGVRQAGRHSRHQPANLGVLTRRANCLAVTQPVRSSAVLSSRHACLVTSVNSAAQGPRHCAARLRAMQTCWRRCTGGLWRRSQHLPQIRSRRRGCATWRPRTGGQTSRPGPPPRGAPCWRRCRSSPPRGRPSVRVPCEMAAIQCRCPRTLPAKRG